MSLTPFGPEAGGVLRRASSPARPARRDSLGHEHPGLPLPRAVGGGGAAWAGHSHYAGRNGDRVWNKLYTNGGNKTTTMQTPMMNKETYQKEEELKQIKPHSSRWPQVLNSIRYASDCTSVFRGQRTARDSNGKSGWQINCFQANEETPVLETKI